MEALCSAGADTAGLRYHEKVPDNRRRHCSARLIPKVERNTAAPFWAASLKPPTRPGFGRNSFSITGLCVCETLGEN